tara:strand:+ start:2068 stop:2652 length:585 start_codon:yes stop_codon:yes gene_type:complete
MSEEKNAQPQADGNSETNPSTQANKNDVPYDRFAEVNQVKNQFKSKNEDLEAQIKEMKAEAENARLESMKKNQKYEDLYNETNSKFIKVQEQNEVLNNDLSAIREGLVNQVSEDRRYITDGMSISNLQKFVQEEQSVANPNKASSARAGETPKGEFNGYNSLQEFAQQDPKGCDEYMSKNVSGYNWGQRTNNKS